MASRNNGAVSAEIGYAAAATTILIALGASGASVSGQAEGLRHETMTFAGRERTYLVYRPRSRPATARLAVVLAFHGGAGTARQMMRWARLEERAEKHGVLVVCPNGIDRGWNDGRENIRRKQRQVAHIDDVAWIGALLKRLEAKEKIDPERIYAMGVSNGGMFTMRLGIELGDRFAAIATVIGSLPKRLASKRPKAPLSVLIMNGTDDPLVPYEGGEISIRSLLPERWRDLPLASRGRVVATKAAVRYWRRHNGIKSAGRVEILPNRDVEDGCRVRKTTWRDTAGGPEVVLYEILGGGHTMPGARQYLPVASIGRTCRDFDGMEAVLRFFLKHRRPPRPKP